MIEGVTVYPASYYYDERGSIYRYMRVDDIYYPGSFGEVYFSTVNPGFVKGWHMHTRQTLHFKCIKGIALLGLVRDTGGHVETQRMRLGPKLSTDDVLVVIEPGLWVGFRAAPAYSDRGVIMVNFTSEPHDPNEIERRPPDYYAAHFDWGEYVSGG